MTSGIYGYINCGLDGGDDMYTGSVRLVGGFAAVLLSSLPAQAGDLSDLIRKAATQGKAYIRNEVNRRLGPASTSSPGAAPTGTMQTGSMPVGTMQSGSTQAGSTQAGSGVAGLPSSEVTGSGGSVQAGTAQEGSAVPIPSSYTAAPGHAVESVAHPTQNDTQSMSAYTPAIKNVSDSANSAHSASAHHSPNVPHGPVINGFGSAKPFAPQASHAAITVPKQASQSAVSIPAESAQGFPVPADAGVPLYRRHDDPLPKYFPVPAYPGSKTSESYTESESIHLGLLTADSVYKVFHYYVDYARDKGFSVPSDWCSADSHNSTLSFKDNRGKWINIGLSHFYEWTEIQIRYQK